MLTATGARGITQVVDLHESVGPTEPSATWASDLDQGTLRARCGQILCADIAIRSNRCQQSRRTFCASRLPGMANAAVNQSTFAGNSTCRLTPARRWGRSYAATPDATR